MITYSSRKYFGWEVLIRVYGSVIPRTIPYALISACVAGYFTEDDTTENKFVHPYAHHVFGIVVGFTLVFRSNISYGRFWEGLTQMQIMSSKWMDGVRMAVVFDELSKNSTCNRFQGRLAHLASLSHALVMMHLRDDQELMHIRADHMMLPASFAASMPLPMPVHTANGNSSGGKTRRGGVSVSAEVSPLQRTWSKYLGKRSLYNVRANEKEHRLKRFVKWMRNTSQIFLLSTRALRKAELEGNPLYVVGGLTKAEAAALNLVPSEDRAFLVMTWIQRLVAQRQKEGGLDVPPPIVSRIWQVLSDGELAAGQCFKLNSSPFPFAFAQLVQLTLLVFCFTAPTVISAFVQPYMLGVVLSFITTMCYFGLNEVARELEEPFGFYPNDIDVVRAQGQFNRKLGQILAGSKHGLEEVSKEEELLQNMGSSADSP